MAVAAILGELLLLGIEKGDGTGEESKVSLRGIGDILVFFKKDRKQIWHMLR